MHITARKDHFSRAWIKALAAASGVGADVPAHDQNSIDMYLRGPDTEESAGPGLDLQLKCTAGVDLTGPDFPFPLDVKNYDDLRRATLVYPRLLVVVVVPNGPDSDVWVSGAGSDDGITLRHRAFWKSLSGEVATANTSTVTVRIPTSQVFDSKALQNQMRRP